MPLPRLPPGAFLACGLVLAVATLRGTAATSDRIHDSIRTKLPKYDPLVRQTVEATAEFTRPNESANSSNKAFVSTPEAEGSTVLLPRIVVRPSDSKLTPVKRVVLPRTITRPAPGPEPEPFLTPAAREAALVEKHFTAFDRKIMNRFTLPLFGASKEERAKEAEAIEQGAKQLSQIADLIEVSSLTEQDPKRTKELKKIYLDAYIARPK